MDKNFKEGISVQELENFGKKYQFEIFFVLYFVLATLLSLFAFPFSAKWSVFLGGIGGVVGILVPSKIDKIGKATFHFIIKQEKVTKLILGIVGVLVSFFLSPIIFFFLGLMGGKGIYCSALKADQGKVESSETLDSQP